MSDRTVYPQLEANYHSMVDVPERNSSRVRGGRLCTPYRQTTDGCCSVARNAYAPALHGDWQTPPA